MRQLRRGQPWRCGHAPVTDGLVGESLEERQQGEEVLDGLAAVAVGRPVAQRQRQALALSLELIGLGAHGVDALHHVSPQVVAKAADGGDDIDVQAAGEAGAQ